MSFDETVLKMVKPQQIHACTRCGCRFGTRQLLRDHIRDQHLANPAIVTTPVRPATQRPITMFVREITTIHANTHRNQAPKRPAVSHHQIIQSLSTLQPINNWPSASQPPSKQVALGDLVDVEDVSLEVDLYQTIHNSCHSSVSRRRHGQSAISR